MVYLQAAHSYLILSYSAISLLNMEHYVCVLYMLSFLGIILPTTVNCHGMMLIPTFRGAIWRFPNFGNFEPNYLDREVHCGGFLDQHWFNDGKCGPCGDNWNDPIPRNYENTGKYGLGIITSNYTMGQDISVEIYIEAAHSGYFEFTMCQLSTPDGTETNECFGQPLFIRETQGYKYPIMWDSGTYRMNVALPSSLICDRCILRWEYITGNTWGDCGNGTEGLGCGPQETFRNCADISISQ